MPATATDLAMYSRAWYGDELREFPVPDSWDVHVLSPPPAPALTEAGLRSAFETPIGTQRISVLARGRADAVIIVDDLSRPTPAAVLIPHVVRELHDAGIMDDRIRIVVGTGSHRPLTDEEIALKVGASIAARYPVTCHSFLGGDCVGFGTLPDGMPVYINRIVAESDFKVAIGSILPHGSVGFGGGAKLIVPGVSGAATMWHFHSCHASRGHGVIEARPGEIDHRVVAEQAAGLIGLDVIVNAIVNYRREVAHLVVGHYIEAHRAGARVALRMYGTEIPRELRPRVDLVVTNCYPLDADPLQTNKALWMRGLFPNARVVVVNPATDGLYYHGLFDRLDYGRYLARRAEDACADPSPPDIASGDTTLVVSEHVTTAEFARHQPKDALVRSWSQAIDALGGVLPERPTVAVFPLGGMQIHAGEDDDERTPLPIP